MRFRILRRELAGLAVSRDRVFGLAIFQQMRECKPGAGLTFFDVVCGLEAGGSAQKTLSLGAVEADEHQSQVQVRLEYFGLGSDRLPVSMDPVLNAAQAVQNDTAI